MTNTKSNVFDQSDVESDLDAALQLMNNYPPEQRTSTLLFLLLRNDSARAAVSSMLSMKGAGYLLLGDNEHEER